MAEDALITAKFQVPASEVEAGVNGRLLLTATLQAASSETIKQTEDVKNVVEQAKDEVNNTFNDFNTEVSNRLGYKLTLNNVTTATYTLAETDEGALVRMDSESENTVTVPTHATVAFEQGTVVNVRQVGLGRTFIEGAAGVTVNGPGDAPYSTDGTEFGIALVKVADNEWDFVKGFEGVPLPEVNGYVEEVETVFEDLSGQIDEIKEKAEGVRRGLAIARADFESQDTIHDNAIEAVKQKQTELSSDLSDALDVFDAALSEADFTNNSLRDKQRLVEGEGYQIFPGGLIIQWMRHYFPHVNRSIEAKVDLPISFPNVCLQPMLSGTRGDTYDGSEGAQVETYDNTSVTVKSYWNRTMGGMWVYILALGY